LLNVSPYCRIKDLDSSIFLVVSHFSDLTQITLTHVGKPGTLYEVRKSDGVANAAPGGSTKDSRIQSTRKMFHQL
jgi:hypothetical protein